MQPAGRTARRRVLLTGAAGGIGRAFFRAAHDRYQFRLADRAAIAGELTLEGDEGEHEAIQLDIVELAACERACEQIDTVVHLAADANPAAPFYFVSARQQHQGDLQRLPRRQGSRLSPCDLRE
jgi:nucleoside-diphosphate-sugar epimerase